MPGVPTAITLIFASAPKEDRTWASLGWIVLGLVAGALAKLIMPGHDPGGILVTMLLGIVGAVVGGFLGSRFFGRGLETFWNLQTWIVAIIGSLILLGLYRLIIGSRAVSR